MSVLAIILNLNYYSNFSGTSCQFAVKGNIMSLLDSTNFSTMTALQSACTFFNLFYCCSGLTDAEYLLLPATTLAASAYTNMFAYCSSLTTAPELPATTLANHCYNNMFSGCISLISAPELPATTLVTRCYYQMFYNCSKLNYIKCLATDISASYSTSYWVDCVASAGTFVMADGTSWTNGVSGIPTGWIKEKNGIILSNGFVYTTNVSTTIDLTITSRLPWQATFPSWLVLSQASGMSGSITINISQVSFEDLRKGEVVFTDNEGQSTTFFIEQTSNTNIIPFTLEILSGGKIYLVASGAVPKENCDETDTINVKE